MRVNLCRCRVTGLQTKRELWLLANANNVPNDTNALKPYSTARTKLLCDWLGRSCPQTFRYLLISGQYTDAC